MKVCVQSHMSSCSPGQSQARPWGLIAVYAADLQAPAHSHVFHLNQLPSHPMPPPPAHTYLLCMSRCFRVLSDKSLLSSAMWKQKLKFCPSSIQTSYEFPLEKRVRKLQKLMMSSIIRIKSNMFFQPSLKHKLKCFYLSFSENLLQFICNTCLIINLNVPYCKYL